MSCSHSHTDGLLSVSQAVYVCLVHELASTCKWIGTWTATESIEMWRKLIYIIGLFSLPVTALGLQSVFLLFIKWTTNVLQLVTWRWFHEHYRKHLIRCMFRPHSSAHLCCLSDCQSVIASGWRSVSSCETCSNICLHVTDIHIFTVSRLAWELAHWQREALQIRQRLTFLFYT